MTDQLKVSILHKTLCKEIENKEKELFYQSNDNRYIPIENKVEIIEHYVNRFIFCDNIKKNNYNFSSMNTEIGKKYGTSLLIQYSDRLRIEIYKDVKKIPYFNEIEQKYLTAIKN